MVQWKIVFRQSLIVICLTSILSFSLLHRRSLLAYRAESTLLEQFDLDCDGVFQEKPEVIEKLKEWDISVKERRVLERRIHYISNNCDMFGKYLGFPERPLSQEETDFPLAYGMLVYKDYLQVLMMFGAFYHPQNQYCIAISETASLIFKEIMRNLESCFPNIHDRPPVTWGGYEIINSTYACFDYLVKSGRAWEYYQYLSGVDLPLRTNLEMVRILKSWNGSSNMDVLNFEEYRLLGKRFEDSPLPVFKSSVSVIIPRNSAEFITYSSITRELLTFLNGTGNSDETFWATLMGNKKLPNAFEGSEIIAYKDKLQKEHSDDVNVYMQTFKEFKTVKWSYYVARMHVWNISPKACKGFFTQQSCVFGVEDLPSLMSQPHFIAHKLYLDYQPAALICGLKKHRDKVARLAYFDISPYNELPLVQLHNGAPLEKMKRPLWLLGETFL